MSWERAIIHYNCTGQHILNKFHVKNQIYRHNLENWGTTNNSNINYAAGGKGTFFGKTCIEKKTKVNVYKALLLTGNF